MARARPVIPGGTGVAMAPTDFGRSAVSISQPGGADYAYPITTGIPRIFRPSYGPENASGILQLPAAFS